MYLIDAYLGFFSLLSVCEAMGSDIYFLQVLACLPVFLQDWKMLKLCKHKTLNMDILTLGGSYK